MSTAIHHRMKELDYTKDATVWADTWLEAIEDNPEIPKDKLAMVQWFYRAMAVGYDAGRKAGESLVIDTEPNHNG